MDRGQVIREDRLAVVLLGSAALTACATPQYAVRAPAGHVAPQAHARSSSAPGGYKTGEPYEVGGIWYVPHEQPNYDVTGIASWYGEAFQLKATADGEIFDMNQFSAAHTTLPLPSMVEVTNLDNGRKLTVRVNDRGPFVGGRIIDLSQAAARELGYDRQGLARVRVRYVGPAPLAPTDAGVRYARATPPAYASAAYRPPAVVPVRPARPADEDIFAEPPARGLQVQVKPMVRPARAGRGFDAPAAVTPPRAVTTRGGLPDPGRRLRGRGQRAARRRSAFGPGGSDGGALPEGRHHLLPCVAARTVRRG